MQIRKLAILCATFGFVASLAGCHCCGNSRTACCAPAATSTCCQTSGYTAFSPGAVSYETSAPTSAGCPDGNCNAAATSSYPTAYAGVNSGTSEQQYSSDGSNAEASYPTPPSVPSSADVTNDNNDDFLPTVLNNGI